MYVLCLPKDCPLWGQAKSTRMGITQEYSANAKTRASNNIVKNAIPCFIICGEH